MNSTKLDLIEKTKSFLSEIESLNPERESLEWYLCNNLRKFLNSVRVADSDFEILNATKILSRFCTESMDWDGQLYKKCTLITMLGFKLGKKNN